MNAIAILIVEDELLIAHNLARILKRLGYRVVEIVSSGERAIQVAAEKKPDLILMDIVIKGQMNGIEAAQEIQNRYGIPIVYVTAYADDATVQRAKLTSAYGFIVKPFRREQLHGAIQVALGHHQRVTEMLQLAQANAQIHILDRHHFLCLVKKDFNDACQYQSTFSIVLISLQFQPLPDVDQDLFEDAIVEAVIKATTPILRRIDYVGRLETDFIVCLPEIDLRIAAEMGKGIAQALSETMITLQEATIPLVVNWGIAAYQSDDESFEMILERARLGIRSNLDPETK